MSPCRFYSTGPSCWINSPPMELRRETQSDFMGFLFPSLLDSWSMMTWLKNLRINLCPVMLDLIIAHANGLSCGVPAKSVKMAAANSPQIYFPPFVASTPRSMMLIICSTYLCSENFDTITRYRVNSFTSTHPETSNKRACADARAFTLSLCTNRGSAFQVTCTFPLCSICIA